MKIAGRLARLEVHHAPSPRAYQIVLYDAATGAPLPGHEPNPKALGSIWIPDNGRITDAFGDEEPKAYGGDTRCD